MIVDPELTEPAQIIFLIILEIIPFMLYKKHYLLYDFNRLERAAENGVNDWNTAFEIGFSIYLNVLNVLLELLEAMG